MEKRLFDPSYLDCADLAHGWHAFTQMQEYAGFPQVHIASGQGCWIYDTEGRHYLDTNASIWTNVHGHNDVELNAALTNQLSAIAHSTWLGLSHPNGALLGKQLATLAPDGLTRTLYSDNGSNAVEIALKLSFQYRQLTGKPEKTCVVGMENAYHGDTFGTMSVSDNPTFHGRFAHWCFEKITFPAPQCSEWNGVEHSADDSRSIQFLIDLFEKESSRISCLVLEPWIQGAAGMRLQPRYFLRTVADLCKAYDVHLILDEVFVGFGRTGDFFVCKQEGVTPDFLCLAKGLSAGYLPLAATLTTEKIYSAFLGTFDSYRAFFHGHTFAANPLASAVALKSIEKLDTMIKSKQLKNTIRYFGNKCAEVFEGHPHVAEIRQRGLACALDLKPVDKDPSRRFPIGERRGFKVCMKAREYGLLLRPLCDSLLIVPPLIINSAEIDFLFENTRMAIEETLAN